MAFFLTFAPPLRTLRKEHVFISFMYYNQRRKATALTWKHYSRKGYSAFASMGRPIRIGVLSVATLGTICPAARAEETHATALEQTADEKELEEVTITDSMSPLTLLQGARLVSVLSRTEIEQAGAECVNDLLKLLPSVDVRQRGGFGIQTDISIDGGTYEQVTLLLNGVNISNPQTGHLSTDLPISPDDVERIEVLEGAASRVYGGQAFGGAINIVTRRERTRRVEANAMGGSHGTAQAGGRVDFSHGSVGHHRSGGGGRSDGGTLNDAWKRGNLFYTGDLTSKGTQVSWQAGYSRKSYGANTFYSGSSNDQWEQNERFMAAVGAENEGKLHLSARAYWIRAYDNYDWHRGTTTNSHQSDVYGARMGSHTDWVAGRTSLSAEVRNEGILSSSLGPDMEEKDWVKAHGSNLLYKKHANRTDVSFNLEHSVTLSHWTLSAGVMANMNTAINHRFRFYPGIDLAYRPNRQWKLFAGYNKGFRLPTYTDLYYNSPDRTGNDQLQAEENQSANIGVQVRPTSGLTGRVRLFYSHGRNLIDYVKTEFGAPARAENFTLHNMGVSTDWALDFHRMAGERCFLNTLSLGYTYIHQKRKGKYPIFTSLYADDYLRHKFTARLNHRIVSRLSATWSVRYQQRMGSYQVYDGLVATDRLRDYRPYATLDLKLQWTDRHYDVYVQATNLTNHRYQDLGNIPQPGIWVMAGARWKMIF